MSADLVTPPGRQGPGHVAPRLVEALDLAVARRAAGLLPGDRPAAGAGAGTELAQIRPYQVGDDVRQLDPSAFARTGEPHVRLQVPERVLTTWLVVDQSPSMAFGSADRLKSDVAEGVVEVLGRLAVRRGGRIGLVACGAPGARALPPRGGRGAAIGVLRAVQGRVAPDGHTDPRALAEALSRVGRTARQSGLVVVVSDFRDAHAVKRPLHALAMRHSVLAVEVTDPREQELPEVGHLHLVDPETGRRVEVDTSRRSLRERFAAAEAERRATLMREIRSAGARHLELSTRGDWLRQLGKAFR